jgi:hypothetical protein
MVTSAQALKKYGAPEKELGMTLWDVPGFLEIGVIPKKLYCNKDMIKPLAAAFQALIATGHVKELKTWDGCFNIRKKRGLNSASLHSWGLAIDVNAAWNGLGKQPTLSAGFVKCFTDNGFIWGGTWKRLDGMHFEIKSI